MRQTAKRKGLGRWALRALGFALFCAVAGFPIFVAQLERYDTGAPRADAIVVLTGGDVRLEKGLALLEQSVAQRLLISGVFQDTRRADLVAQSPGSQSYFECCVDLGRSAPNTLGNAAETAAWVHARGFRSLIVVTAAYHMPRSLIEMRAQMPGITLYPKPVHPETITMDRWWTDRRSAYVLANEYLKFLAAHGRIAVFDLVGLRHDALAEAPVIEEAPGRRMAEPAAAAQAR